jgi:hypothetical protein
MRFRGSVRVARFRGSGGASRPAVAPPTRQGRTEALNNKVRPITCRAYGFHSAEAALALVMLTCGPITLAFPHETYLPITTRPTLTTSMPREPNYLEAE